MKRTRSWLRRSAVLLFILGLCLSSRVTAIRCHKAGFEIVAVYGSSPMIDGLIDIEEWMDAEVIYFGYTQAFVKQDGINLYMGFNVSLHELGSLEYVAVFFDVDHDGNLTLQMDDFLIAVTRLGELIEQNVTNYNWNPNPTNVSGWTAKTNSTVDIWQAELNITYSKIDVTAATAKAIGIMFSVCKTPSVHYYWPLPAYVDSPSTWGDVTIDRSQTWTVDVNGQADFDTIQEAINNAAGGDTVFIKAGTYYEHVVVNKTVSLVGEDSITTIIDGNWTGVVIDVTQDGVIVSGLTVQRSGSIYWENAGILLDNVENCRISENILTENSFAGLELNHSSRCSILENSIVSNGGVGITLVGGSSNDLSRNSFSENGWSALTLNDEANNNTICENIMTSNSQAVMGHCVNLYRSSNNSIQKNRISGDDNGIRLEYWSNLNTISQNNITNNIQTAVSIERYSDNNTVVRNNIIENAYGICFDLFTINSTQNMIVNNNMINNTQQVRIVPGSVNAWNGSYAIGGNYWSDYSGLDQFSGPYQNVTGSDQIGDSPYIIDAANKDNYPLMTPWMPYALTTDINDDGAVNILDITIVAKAFGSGQGEPTYNEAADLDRNGQVNIIDISMVAKDFGKTE